MSSLFDDSFLADLSHSADRPPPPPEEPEPRPPPPPEPWLAPYLNLVAGPRKLCASQLEPTASQPRRDEIADDGRRQLTRARDGGHPLIRVAAEHLLSTAARSCSPSP